MKNGNICLLLKIYVVTWVVTDRISVDTASRIHLNKACKCPKFALNTIFPEIKCSKKT